MTRGRFGLFLKLHMYVPRDWEERQRTLFRESRSRKYWTGETICIALLTLVGLFGLLSFESCNLNSVSRDENVGMETQSLGPTCVSRTLLSRPTGECLPISRAPLNVKCQKKNSVQKEGVMARSARRRKKGKKHSACVGQDTQYGECSSICHGIL